MKHGQTTYEVHPRDKDNALIFGTPVVLRTAGDEFVDISYGDLQVRISLNALMEAVRVMTAGTYG